MRYVYVEDHGAVSVSFTYLECPSSMHVLLEGLPLGRGIKASFTGRNLLARV